ncbi:MAG: MFS transporter, partial [Anaerolineae bacterium]
DHLYIPLGGNRAGRWRTHLNLVITFALGGLWHGASWMFVIWGLLPLLALQKDLRVEQAATIGAVYLAVWGSSQLLTGPLSDRLGRKPLITGGLLLQSVGILLLALLTDYAGWLITAGVMGIGTGMVYPTLLAAVSDVANPLWRASALGVYRLWRDSGYAFGALFGGILADLFTLQTAVVAVGLLTLVSGLVTAILLSETIPDRPTSVAYPARQGEKLA